MERGVKMGDDKSNYISLEDLIDTYGYDLSCVDFANVLISPFEKLEKVILPNDEELFQKIYDKSLRYVYMGDKDYSKFNFKGVDIFGTIFGENSKIPHDINFFQGIYRKSLQRTTLPSIDFSNYNFNEVCIENTIFPRKAKLPKNRNLFQSIKDKSLGGTVLPDGDYSKYNFSGVKVGNTIFTDTSRIGNINFFQDIFALNITGTHLPSESYENFNFNKVRIYHTAFGKNAVLPTEENFLKKPNFVKFEDNIFPNSFLDIIDFYDTEGIKIEYDKLNISDSEPHAAKSTVLPDRDLLQLSKQMKLFYGQMESIALFNKLWVLHHYRYFS